MTSLSAQIRDYDICFAEFLEPSGNGQKFIQAILLREAFRRCAQPLASSISAIATSLRDRSDQIAKIGLTPTRPAGRITGLYDTFIGTRANRARNSIEAGPIVRVS